MPPIIKGITFDVAKDPLDLRDLYYEGSLKELPDWIDNRGKVPYILDQGSEGACTGFGLAAVVNFLRHNKSGAPPLRRRKDGASTRMLYNMARRYDEWEGERYEGSSIRGAMKGWYKHGVCHDGSWPYKPKDERSRLTAKRQEEAVETPLGNYRRVRHNHLSHMHSALNEVGILYASGSVHDGWFKVDPETGHLPLRRTLAGGHAFAIVGYDERGFWLVNSWTKEWGRNGFANISYDDWLQNGFDCWVARLGVVTRSVVLTEDKEYGRVMGFDFVPHESVTRQAIQSHLINLGNDGLLSTSGAYQTQEPDIKAIFDEHIPETTKQWAGPCRIVLYALGGLNDEKASAVRIASMKPFFIENNIYPIHFMWETGLLDAITNMVKDVFRQKRFGGVWESVRDKFLELKDEGIELAARSLGRPIWSEMKENGRLASERAREHTCGKQGGADLLAQALSVYRDQGNRLDLHLVGHSAGSILLAHLLPALEAWNLKVETMTLFAPACTTELCVQYILPSLHRSSHLKRLTIFNLKDEVEQDDHVVHVYNKSLLYLVSEAFEKKRKTPLLGMESYLTKDDEILNVIGKPVLKSKSVVIRSTGGANVKLRSSSTSHGGFDNDPDTLNSMLRIIRGSNQLVMDYSR